MVQKKCWVLGLNILKHFCAIYFILKVRNVALINWWFTQLGKLERESLLSAYDGRKFSMGPLSAELESKLAALHGAKHAILTPSGTAALTLSLSTLGIGPGDEVIVPSHTWIATAQAASRLGATVVLADCSETAPLIDPEKVQAVITNKTKAILPVHFHGRSCDMSRILKIAKSENLYVVEDACKSMYCKSALGYLGTIGDVGCFSLGMISLLSVGYGGFVLTNDSELNRRMRLVRDHGLSRVPQDVYEYDGFNFKISDLTASIGIAQILRLDEKIKHLNEVYQIYYNEFLNCERVSLLPVDVKNGMIPICVDLVCKERTDLENFLSMNGVEISKFHPALHHAPYYSGQAEHFRNSERFSNEGFMPPCGPSQPLENVHQTIDLIHKWLK